MYQKHDDAGYAQASDIQHTLDCNDISRRDTRSIIFHLLYAMEGFEYDVSLESVVDNFNKGFELDIPRDCLAVRVTRQVINQREALDEQIKPLLHNWRFERIGVVTKLILRFALWELNQPEVQPALVINEAIELAKCFAEKDAYKFINGILDEQLNRMGYKKEEIASMQPVQQESQESEE